MTLTNPPPPAVSFSLCDKTYQSALFPTLPSSSLAPVKLPRCNGLPASLNHIKTQEQEASSHCYYQDKDHGFRLHHHHRHLHHTVQLFIKQKRKPAKPPKEKGFSCQKEEWKCGSIPFLSRKPASSLRPDPEHTYSSSKNLWLRVWFLNHFPSFTLSFRQTFTIKHESSALTVKKQHCNIPGVIGLV